MSDQTDAETSTSQLTPLTRNRHPWPRRDSNEQPSKRAAADPRLDPSATAIGTSLFAPWSRVLLEKLTVFAASQQIPRILWNPKVHYRIHKCPPPVFILSQLHSVSTPSHFLKIHLNIILPSTSGSPQWYLKVRRTHYTAIALSNI